MEGIVSQVIGPVVDVDFDNGQLPNINDAIEINYTVEGKNVNLICSEPCFYFKRKLFPFC